MLLTKGEHPLQDQVFRMDRSHMIKTILNLTVDIIYLLTGEEYCVVKQRSGERLFPSSNTCMLLRWNRTQSQKQDQNNEQAILELTNKIIKLLTGEDEDLIAIKVEVTEKEELFGSDVQKCEEEEEVPVTIKTVGFLRCPSRLDTRDPSEQNNNVPQDKKDRKLKDARGSHCQNENTKDYYHKSGQLCKEEQIATYIGTDGYNFGDYTCEERHMLPATHEMDDVLLRSSPRTSAAAPDSYLSPLGNPFNTTAMLKQTYMPLADEYCFTVTRQQDSPEEGKPFSCPECGKGFTKKSSLVRHQIIHMGQKPFLCTVCSKCFARKSTLVEHKKTHTCEKPYACSDCGKCFVRKANLLDHQRIHTGEKSFPCPVCGKCFTNKTILLRHQKSHTGEKPFSCAECGKCFGHKSVLVKHQIVHTGEKPFPCSECGKCFTQKGNLMEHQKIHTGERPFFCNYCGKYFTNKAVLMRHQVTHSQQTPFSCPQCDKCFMHEANLAKHEDSHLAEAL